MSEDLWPDNIADSNLVTPATILKEQAAALGNRTQQLLKGEVVTQPSGTGFVHRFNLVAPTMNYRYELFHLTHGISFYPCTLKIAGDNILQSLNSEEDFRAALKRLFASQQTLNVVGSILAQVRS